MVDVSEIVLEIKRKKELRNISDSFLERLILKELDKRPYLKEVVLKEDLKSLKRDPEFLRFFKEIRGMLHEIFGVFAPKDIKKIYSILDDEDLSIVEKIKEILKLSRPTKERLNFYRYIYDQIFEVYKPKTILDLASGLNPLSILLVDYRPEKYYFDDISLDLLTVVEEILKENGVDANGLDYDLFEILNYRRELPDVDMLFLWKTIPIIEKYSPEYSVELLRSINYQFAVISFSKKSLSGRRELGRAWIPWLKRRLDRIGAKYVKEFETPNERFVILKKSAN